MKFKPIKYLRENLNLICYSFLWGLIFSLGFSFFRDLLFDFFYIFAFIGGFISTFIYEKRKRKEDDFYLTFYFKKTNLKEMEESKKNFLFDILILIGLLISLIFLLFILLNINPQEVKSFSKLFLIFLLIFSTTLFSMKLILIIKNP